MNVKRVCQFFCLLFLISFVKMFGMEASDFDRIPVPIKFQNQLPQEMQLMEDIDDDFLGLDDSVCPEAKVDEIEKDEEGDVFMTGATSSVPEKINTQNQSSNQFRTKEGLMQFIHWLKETNVSEEYKKTLLNALFENLWQIKQSSLSGWFLYKLRENGLEGLWKEVLLKL